MILKKIKYIKKNITFDYFEIWMGEHLNVFDHVPYQPIRKEDVERDATCVSTQICPWCTKKYGLYNEVERTPEDIDEEIKFYENEGPEELDCKCGIDGCNNGIADYVDILWSDGFEIVDGE